jgi:hypothetical protein
MSGKELYKVVLKPARHMMLASRAEDANNLTNSTLSDNMGNTVISDGSMALMLWLDW